MTEQQAEQPYNLGVSYDHRFGLIGLHVTKEGAEPIRFVTRLDNMLTQLGLTKPELIALLSEEYQSTAGFASIDPARVRMLEETDWQGKTVLDVGGYDGFAAEIAHKGGAKRAICLDNHQYEHYGWKDILKEGVEYIQGDFSKLVASDVIGFDREVDHGAYMYSDFIAHRPDVLINYNVLYHVKNPWAFLDKCREIIKPDGEMLLCTLFRYHDGPWMYVYEPKECNPTDDTVYFGPSLEALERLLRLTGWDATRYALSHDRVLYRCKPTPGFTRQHEDT